MNRSIGEFKKTDHFMYRQWDRGVSDYILSLVLKKIPSNKKNTLYVISKQVLKNLNKTINQELFIKIDDNTLITCFYCDFQNYRNSKREQQYSIISR